MGVRHMVLRTARVTSWLVLGLAFANCRPNTGAPGPEVIEQCVEGTEVGPSQMRRLTRVQYERTVSTLFDMPLPLAEVLPADSNSLGFDNQAAVQEATPTDIESWQLAAETVTSFVFADGASGALGCDPAIDGCLQTFLPEFGRRAFRRPLTDDEIGRYVAFFEQAQTEGTSPDRAAELLVQGMLMSPNFLYLVETGSEGETTALDDFAIATRLSYLLWNTMPDDALLDAAEAGELSDPSQIRAHTQRMLDDPRAADVVADFYAQWIGARELRSAAVPPGFDNSLLDSMRASSDQFLRAWHADGARFDQLLTSTRVFVNDELARYYGLDQRPGESLASAQLDPAKYAGLLTRPEMVVSHNVPPSRGALILSNLLCTPLALPSDPVPDPPESAEYTTRRERFEAHSQMPCAVACHSTIDPLGFPFEHYDVYGQWQDMDNGVPVDASVELPPFGPVLDGEIADAVELSHLLAAEPKVLACHAEQWFTYAHGRAMADEDSCGVQLVEKALSEGGTVQSMLLALTQTEAFRSIRKLPPGEE